jgi:hypothetical protein
MADGHLNKCKKCTKKDTKDNTDKNHDYYLEYDRSRASLPHRVEARLAYSQTETGKESARKAKEKWKEENVIKRSANIIIVNAVRDGKIIKPEKCESCGCIPTRLHGHHDDYNFPLTVRWLCSKCHTLWHKENGSGING